jgi:glycine cleavage system H protein
MNPQDLLYSKEHEWIRIAGDIGTVGITDHAQAELGDVIYVELPEAGARVEAGKALGTIESVKAVSEIFSPSRVKSSKLTRTDGCSGNGKYGSLR